MTDSEKLDLIISKLVETDKKLAETDRKLTETDRKLTETNLQLTENTRELAESNKKLDKLEHDITDMKITLENEIRTNIKRVAEGHLDLSRNLHEALKIDNEKEMLSIRVNVLETEIRRIKAHLQIA